MIALSADAAILRRSLKKMQLLKILIVLPLISLFIGSCKQENKGTQGEVMNTDTSIPKEETSKTEMTQNEIILKKSESTGEKYRRYGKLTEGKKFLIENIYEREVEVVIIKKKDKFYIRSWYTHGWKREQRDYIIPGPVTGLRLDHNKIEVTHIHSLASKEELVSSIFMINKHGEAKKVDVTTMTDLTW